jgi:putative ABC transport system permease protein
MQVPFRIAGREQVAKKSHSLADYRTITPAFFETMRIPIRRGRDFTEGDNAKTSLVFIINDVLARTYFSGRNPIGERLELDSEDKPQGEIVGIVGDVKHRGIEAEAFPTIYVNYLQNFSSVPNFPIMIYVVRSKTAPGALAERAQSELQSLDTNQVIFNVRPMEYLLADARTERRFTMMLLAIFAALALTLAAVGIYGVTSYSVAQRTREIGIRMALGAQRSDLMQGVLGQGLRMTLLGVGIGTAITYAATRLMESLLYGVSARDPIMFALTAALLTMVAILACYIPARRATKVDPMVALRCE